MSIRLKALLVAIQISALVWGALFYIGHAFYTSQYTDVDMISTASTE